MGTRSTSEAQAISESQRVEVEQKRKHRPGGDASDVDRELELFFGGGYVADAGLHCGLGHAGSGGGGGLPDGWNDAVRFGVVGPAGRLEQGLVSAALQRMLGDPPKPTRLMTTKERERVEEEWRLGVPVLRAYYTPPRPTPNVPSTKYAGLVGLDDFAPVALVAPRAQPLIEIWRFGRRADEIVSAARSAEESQLEAAIRLDELRAEIAEVEEAIEMRAGLRLQLERLRKRLAAAERPGPAVDRELAVREKWSRVTDAHRINALRSLCAAASARKYTTARREATESLKSILDESKRLWRVARAAYASERRRVDQDLRDTARRQRAAALSNFARSLVVIPADAD